MTYQQLKERGFTGTRYDAELVQNLGHYEDRVVGSNPICADLKLNQIQPTLPNNSVPIVEASGNVVSNLMADFGVKQPPFPKGIRVHQRSLRCTPDRIRKRCQLGRAPSDSR